MKSCSACTYRFKKSDGKQFHRFPSTRPDIFKKWVEACRRKNWSPSRWSMLCSNHFTDDDYQLIPGSSRQYLREDAVPSIFNFPSRLVKQNKHYDESLVTDSKTQHGTRGQTTWVKDVGTQSFIRSKDMCTQNCPVVRHASTQIREPSVEETRLKRKVKVLEKKLKHKTVELEAVKSLLKSKTKSEVYSIRNYFSNNESVDVPVYTLKVDLFE